MINLIALWIVLSSVGAAIVMSPESFGETHAHAEHNPLEVGKEATSDSFHYASEAARKTGQGIKRTVASAAHFPAHAAEAVQAAVQRKAGEVAQTVKYGSQAGLEKIGLAVPQPPPPTTFEQWESGLQASKERAEVLKAAAAESAVNTKEGVQGSYVNAKEGVQDSYANAKEDVQGSYVNAKEGVQDSYVNAKEGVQDSYVNAKEGVQDSYKKHLKKEDPRAPFYDVVKENVVDAYDCTKDATGNIAEAASDRVADAAHGVKGTIVGTGEKIQHGVYGTYKSAEGVTVAAKDGVSHAAAYAQHKAFESADFVNELAMKIVQTVQDYIISAGAKAAGTAGSAYEHAADGLKGASSKAKSFIGIDNSPPSYQQKIQQATEQAAETLIKRGKEAAVYMPMVGQGLSYVTPNLGDVASTANQAGEYVEGVKGTAGGYVDSAKEKIVGSGESDTWRREFLDRVGIRSEKDLSNKDVLVGNFEGVYSGGVFHMAGGVLRPATVTQDALNPVEEKAPERVSEATEHEVMHDAESFLNPPLYPDLEKTEPIALDVEPTTTLHSYEEAPAFKSKTANSVAHLWRTVSSFSAGWLMSSCKALHLFAFSSSYGASLWVTFISGYLLSRTIPRHQFGYVQSRVFPVYLNLIASGQAVCLVLYMILHPWSESVTDEKYQYLGLWATVLATLTNVFFLEPRATKIMFEKIRIEKEEGKGHDGVPSVEDVETRAQLAKVNDNFRALHGYSSLANLLSLIGMTWHLCHLSARLNV